MELLCPAGDRESLVAAVQNGADAVYLGARGFNARRGADNFAGGALYEAVRYCHARGVRVHVTLNTMVRQDEYAELEKTISEIYMSGADAFIIQDLGVAELARRIAPDMERHASTQMAVHNRQGVEFLARRGFSRAVLAREMEFSEIRACAGLGVELETFGHGALCVSCSGQCLFSSIIGGRSGNRGMCAQPCRMQFSMDGKTGCLLSTRDLMTVDMLDAFRDAGVDSLKIEGRLKRPEYVAVVTGIYRRAMDGKTISEKDITDLKQIFNRGGFTRGCAPGLEERTFMFSERPNNNGVAVGRCTRAGQFLLSDDVDAADTLVIRGAGEDIPVKLSGAAGFSVDCLRAKSGDSLVRLVSERQLARARESYNSEHRAVGVSAHAVMRVGAPVRIEVTGGGGSAACEGAEVAKALKRPFDPERAKEQLNKTGGTPYRMDEIHIDYDNDAFVAMSDINAVRRDALEALTENRCGFSRTPGDAGEMPAFPAYAGKTALLAQSGSVRALKLAVQNGADGAVFAPEDMRALDKALEIGRFYLALPQVCRAEELDALNRWALSHADRILGVYISNVSQLDLRWPGEIIGDYQLNIASSLSLAQTGLERYTPSVEMTAGQISLVEGKRDLIIYGRLPLMQLRHCPRRAALGLAGKHADCRMCDGSGAAPLTGLTDRKGVTFPLRRMAYDSGCVIQVLNSVPLMLLRRLDRLPSAAAWRMLVTDADAAQAARLHRCALDSGDFKGLPEWQAMDEMSTTTGHYFRGVE